MRKLTVVLFIVFLTISSYSQSIDILVWTKSKSKTAYKKGIDEVVADGLNKTAGISATSARDDENLLTETNLSKFDALFLFHATGIKSSSQAAIVSLVESGKLGLVASHDALRDNDQVRELVGMTRMYTDYFDKQEIWSVDPGHFITQGVPDTFSLDPGQPYITFTVNPDVHMIFKGRSTKDKDLNIGWTRTPSNGRTFYFCPDHETYANYNNQHVQKILSNAAFWVTQKETSIKFKKTKANQFQFSRFNNSLPWGVYFSTHPNPDTPGPIRTRNVLGKPARILKSTRKGRD